MPIYPGYVWPSPNLTYSFLHDGDMCFGAPSKLYAMYDAVYPTAVWQAEFVRALNEWAKYSLLTFSLVEWTGVTITSGIRFGASAGVNGLGHAMYPTSGLVGVAGAGVLEIDNPDVPNLFSVVLHELGAALGLGEGSPNPSVMNGPGPYTGLFADDVVGIQHLYGVNPNAPPIPTPPTPPPPPTVPPAPATISIVLQWTAVLGAAGYQVDWSADGHIWHFIARRQQTWMSVKGLSYKWYRVRSYNTAGMGPAIVIKA